MRTWKELSVKEQIGQRFIVGFLEPELTEECKAFLAEYKVGNIILFARNAVSRVQLTRLCREIHEEIMKNTGIPPFICIDQEGGKVTRLPEDCVNIPGAAEMAAAGEESIYEAGRLTGRELKEVGVNFNLAPVLDVNSNPLNPIIGDRSYSSDPVMAGKCAMAMAKGLTDEGILACGKHFPGHGDTSTDSHLTLPMVPKTREELEKTELVPFRYAASEGIPAIMTTHILFPEMNGEREGWDDVTKRVVPLASNAAGKAVKQVPATMSKVMITELLREEIGFDGLVLSDCLEMKAISDFYGVVEGSLAAMQAGVDLVLVSHTRDWQKQGMEQIRKALAEGELPEENMQKSLERILAYKEKYLKEV